MIIAAGLFAAGILGLLLLSLRFIVRFLRNRDGEQLWGPNDRIGEGAEEAIHSLVMSPIWDDRPLLLAAAFAGCLGLLYLSLVGLRRNL